eukprot:scaffold143_cov260-Pinguiococcus_pyrenoidosus.AAC.42
MRETFLGSAFGAVDVRLQLADLAFEGLLLRDEVLLEGVDHAEELLVPLLAVACGAGEALGHFVVDLVVQLRGDLEQLGVHGRQLVTKSLGALVHCLAHVGDGRVEGHSGALDVALALCQVRRQLLSNLTAHVA